MAKILVVDDEEHIVMILKDSLEFSGFQVVTAYNGVEALERVELDSPDLIILDIGMPKLDGWEVCRRLKSDEKTKAIPVIILTAYAQTSDQRKGMQLGADRFDHFFRLIGWDDFVFQALEDDHGAIQFIREVDRRARDVKFAATGVGADQAVEIARLEFVCVLG